MGTAQKHHSDVIVLRVCELLQTVYQKLFKDNRTPYKPHEEEQAICLNGKGSEGL